MGFFADLVWNKRDIFGLRGESPWNIADFSGSMTKSGAVISESNSLSIPTVWACVRLLAWSKASLPLFVFRRVGQGKEKAVDDPRYKLLHDSPNPEQTAFEFRSLMSAHQNLWGAGIAEIVFKDGIASQLWPLPPWLVKPVRKEDGSLWYEVRTNKTKRHIPYYNIYILTNLTTSADTWLSPIGVHRETIGMSMALAEFGAKTFGQGTNPSGILKYPGKVREQSEKSLRDKLKTEYEGLSNSHRLMLLEEGMDFQRVGIPPEDAQYLQTRTFSVYEICRIFNVPSFMVQETTKSTSFGTGIEEMNMGFVTYSLMPGLVQDEQIINKRILLGEKEIFAEYNLDALLRGRTIDRVNAYVPLMDRGVLSIDEVRAKENLNPLPDGAGQKHYVQLNMTSVENGQSNVEQENQENEDEEQNEN